MGIDSDLQQLLAENRVMIIEQDKSIAAVVFLKELKDEDFSEGITEAFDSNGITFKNVHKFVLIFILFQILQFSFIIAKTQMQ